VRGVEVAELCPALDVDDRTARLGAALIFEIASTLADLLEEENSGAAESEVEESEDDDPNQDES
jgi:hypothetical protein